MTESIVAQFQPREPEPLIVSKPHVQALIASRLQQIETELGALLIEAALLQQSANHKTRNSAAPIVLALMHDGKVGVAEHAAKQAVMAAVESACQEVLDEWGTHSAGDFLETRLQEVRAKVMSRAGSALTEYFAALRHPEEFCTGEACGHRLTTSVERLRGVCHGCYAVGLVERRRAR